MLNKSGLRASLRYARRRTGERAALRDPWLDPKWVYAHVVEKTDPAMPLIVWDPAPQGPRAAEAPALLQQPPEGPRDERSRR